jgi:hypothetical protein
LADLPPNPGSLGFLELYIRVIPLAMCKAQTFTLYLIIDPKWRLPKLMRSRNPTGATIAKNHSPAKTSISGMFAKCMKKQINMPANNQDVVIKLCEATSTRSILRHTKLSTVSNETVFL